MQYGEDDVAEDGVQPRTAFRDAEKKYQLFRERKMKMKRGKLKPGKLVTRPIDMSDVLDLHAARSDLLIPEVVRHEVPGYDVPVYTFKRHPGLVFMPSALPLEQQRELTTAALTDYPEPPARTNHVLQYGPMSGLWRAAQQGLRLNWVRRDGPRADAAVSTDEGALQAWADSAGQAEAAVAAPCAKSASASRGCGSHPPSTTTTTTSRSTCCCSAHDRAQSEDLLQHGRESCSLNRAASAQRRSEGKGHAHNGFGADENGRSGGSATAPLGLPEVRCAESGNGDSAEGADGDGTCGGNRSNRSCSSDGDSDSDSDGRRSRRASDSGSDCCGDGATQFAPSFEECWGADGPGPPAEKLLRKLRWATLGPQFDWSQRRYDFEGVFRPLPPTLECLARQLAGVVDSLQGAGLEVMPSAAACGYRPDAAIINYYQLGDVLGGHLDDVERDMAQPIVSVSLGCPAIFLMGGSTKHQVPSALLLRGGDVLVLAGEARRCYHGVPRILSSDHGLALSPARGSGVRSDPVDIYTQYARINISVRAIS